MAMVKLEKYLEVDNVTKANDLAITSSQTHARKSIIDTFAGIDVGKKGMGATETR